MLLEQLLYQQHKIAEKVGDKYLPIPSFNVELAESNLVIKITSDSASETNFLGANAAVKYLSDEGEITGNQYRLILGEYFFAQVPLPEGENFNLSIDIPFWLKDARIQIWKGEEVPQYPIFPTSTSRTSIPQTPTSTAVSATAVSIAAARAGRNRLSIYNNSNGALYIRYAAVGTGTSATTASYDEIIAAGNYFEFPGNDFPESAINGLWVAPSGAALSGNCIVSEGIRG